MNNRSNYENSVKMQFNLNKDNNWTNQVQLINDISITTNAFLQVLASPESLITISGISLNNYQIDENGTEFQSNTILSGTDVYVLNSQQTRNLTIQAIPQDNFENKDINVILIFYNFQPELLTP